MVDYQRQREIEAALGPAGFHDSTEKPFVKSYFQPAGHQHDDQSNATAYPFGAPSQTGAMQTPRGGLPNVTPAKQQE